MRELKVRGDRGLRVQRSCGRAVERAGELAEGGGAEERNVRLDCRRFEGRQEALMLRRTSGAEDSGLANRQQRDAVRMRDAGWA